MNLTVAGSFLKYGKKYNKREIKTYKYENGSMKNVGD